MKSGYEPWVDAPWEPRRWQREAFPIVQRKLGQKPLVRAVTGAGKSIFLAELANAIEGKVVITTPTVKLVDQLAATLKARGMRVGKFYTNAKQYAPRVIVCCNDSLPSLMQHLEREPYWSWIADEAHRTETEQIISSIEMNEPRLRVGVTATPYRSDTSERISMFETLAYNYGPRDALRDGVVVPLDIRNHGWERGRALNDVCLELIDRAKGPGVVDAQNITDAEEFAEMLRLSGISAKAVHSKLDNTTVERRVADLERGELDCIVHVSMLSEGVDMPWLRWIMCRREIGSRVRFAQYVGRGIRCLDPVKHAHHIDTHGEKKACVVYDVHNLFQVLDLDYDAILGMGEVDELEEATLELDHLIEEAKEAMKNSDSPMETLAGKIAKVVPAAIAYLTRTRLEFQFRGFIWESNMDALWRRKEVRKSQLREIRRLEGWGAHITVPRAHRRALQAALAIIEQASRGSAHDLILILSTIGKHRQWPLVDGEEGQGE